MAFRCKEVFLVIMMLHAVAVWSDSCPAGQVPDGIGGNCVSCNVCEKYPTSPFCNQCAGTSNQSGGKDGLKIGLGVGAAAVALALAAAGALLYWKPWRRIPVLQPNHDGNAVQQPPQVVEHRPCSHAGCAQIAIPGQHQPMRGEMPGHAQEEQGARADRNPACIALGSYQHQMDAQPLLPLTDHNRNTAPKEAREER